MFQPFIFWGAGIKNMALYIICISLYWNVITIMDPIVSGSSLISGRITFANKKQHHHSTSTTSHTFGAANFFVKQSV